MLLLPARVTRQRLRASPGCSDLRLLQPPKPTADAKVGCGRGGGSCCSWGGGTHGEPAALPQLSFASEHSGLDQLPKSAELRVQNSMARSGHGKWVCYTSNMITVHSFFTRTQESMNSCLSVLRSVKEKHSSRNQAHVPWQTPSRWGGGSTCPGLCPARALRGARGPADTQPGLRDVIGIENGFHGHPWTRSWYQAHVCLTVRRTHRSRMLTERDLQQRGGVADLRVHVFILNFS